MTEDTWSHGRDGATASRYGRRRFIAVGSGVGAALLAGCTADDGGDDGTPTDDGGDGSGGGETANFRLLVSDAPADIDDFDRLDVTFSRARVFEGGDEEGGGTEDDEQETEDDEQETEDDEQETEDDEQETESGEADEEGTETENGTDTGTDAEDGTATETEEDTETDDESEDDGGDRGFYVLELDSPTVDLTRVVGDVAQPIFDGELEAGSYQKLELHVENVEGIVDGEAVEVKVPSEKLQLTKPFEVRAGEELDFVFDVNVVKRGNQASYNLKPVVSQSGVRGEDVEVEEVGDESDGEDGEGEGEGDGEQGGGSDDGAGSDGTDDEGGDGAGDGTETGGAGNETGGNETGGNESAA